MQKLRLKKGASIPWLMQLIFPDPEAESKEGKKGLQGQHQAAVSNFPPKLSRSAD